MQLAATVQEVFWYLVSVQLPCGSVVVEKFVSARD